MTFHDLLEYAMTGIVELGTIEERTEITMFADTYNDLLSTSLEDLNLSRLDLDEMEQDFLSISGERL